jgi:hypothetical protein
VAEAAAIEAAYRHKYNHSREMTLDERAQLEGLKGKVDEEMAHAGAGYFIRLASRSPKDAAIFSRAELDAATAKIAAAEPEPAAGGTPEATRANHRLRAFCDLSIMSLRVSSGEAAVNLFVSSERVFRDVIEALAAREACGFTQKVVVREWEPLLDQEFEFRGFVTGGKLTALSQYNHMVHFPEQVKRKAELLHAIAAFWETSVRDRLAAQYARYIVDFAVLRDGRVIVIELNPFDNHTGAGLYSWGSEKDVDVMEGRAGLLELVLAATPPDNQAMLNEMLEGELQG